MRISDWSSDVCSSDLTNSQQGQRFAVRHDLLLTVLAIFLGSRCTMPSRPQSPRLATHTPLIVPPPPVIGSRNGAIQFAMSSAPYGPGKRSEEHTSEIHSLIRTTYAVFSLLKKHINKIKNQQ